MTKVKSSAPKGRRSQGKSSILPIFLVLGGAVLLVTFAFLAFQNKPTPFTAEVTGGPSLKADKEKVDLGNVKLGAPVQVSFKIQNNGDQPLQFSKAPYVEVKEGC